MPTTYLMFERPFCRSPRARLARFAPTTVRRRTVDRLRLRLTLGVLTSLCVLGLVTAPTPAGAATTWTNVVNDQFNTGSIPSHWLLYTSRYSVSGNCPSPTHEYVSGGYLHLLMAYDASGSCGPGWYTGGMALQNTAPYLSDNQRVTLRWRVVPHGGIVSHRIIPMFHPAPAPDGTTTSNGEIDLCESGSDSYCSTFIHYGTDGRVYATHTVDLTQWHTMRFVQNDFAISAYIDNMTTPVWSAIYNPTILPTMGRKVVLQQECQPPSAGGCPQTTSGSEDIQIDWIKVDHP